MVGIQSIYLATLLRALAPPASYCSAGDEFRRVAPFSLPDYSCQIAYTSGNAIQNIK
jgi:hypothetical protein